ncbi:hypothetical protein GCM10008094_09860 [Aidingimonas halophila]|nr:hypothetical protein GCM10008094_09860 [Aidingimonas halophila]
MKREYVSSQLAYYRTTTKIRSGDEWTEDSLSQLELNWFLGLLDAKENLVLIQAPSAPPTDNCSSFFRRAEHGG